MKHLLALLLLLPSLAYSLTVNEVYDRENVQFGKAFNCLADPNSPSTEGICWEVWLNQKPVGRLFTWKVDTSEQVDYIFLHPRLEHPDNKILPSKFLELLDKQAIAESI